MQRLPPVSALRVFEVAARHQSFRRAAEELCVTPTAISHQIRSLEQMLGVRLFDRRARGVELTPAAQSLFPVLRDGFAAFALAVQAVRRHRETTTVTVNPARTFPPPGRDMGVPSATEFIERH